MELPTDGSLCTLRSMSAPFLCRLGYHRFGAWEIVQVHTQSAQSVKSPRRQDYKSRRCRACGLVHTDYSPQEGMQVGPPA